MYPEHSTPQTERQLIIEMVSQLLSSAEEMVNDDPDHPLKWEALHKIENLLAFLQKAEAQARLEDNPF